MSEAWPSLIKNVVWLHYPQPVVARIASSSQLWQNHYDYLFQAISTGTLTEVSQSFCDFGRFLVHLHICLWKGVCFHWHMMTHATMCQRTQRRGPLWSAVLLHLTFIVPPFKDEIESLFPLVSVNKWFHYRWVISCWWFTILKKCPSRSE